MGIGRARAAFFALSESRGAWHDSCYNSLSRQPGTKSVAGRSSREEAAQSLKIEYDCGSPIAFLIRGRLGVLTSDVLI
jgi:hypothetical protein